jgi:hypothetical protein
LSSLDIVLIGPGRCWPGFHPKVAALRSSSSPVWRLCSLGFSALTSAPLPPSTRKILSFAKLSQHSTSSSIPSASPFRKGKSFTRNVKFARCLHPTPTSRSSSCPVAPTSSRRAVPRLSAWSELHDYPSQTLLLFPHKRLTVSFTVQRYRLGLSVGERHLRSLRPQQTSDVGAVHARTPKPTKSPSSSSSQL